MASDEILSHGSTSRGVILVLFMAAMLCGIARAPLCYFFGLLDVIYNTMLPSSIPKLSASSQNMSVLSDRAF